jgi:hypothetical protein
VHTVANSPTHNTRVPPSLWELVEAELVERRAAGQVKVSRGLIVCEALELYFSTGGWRGGPTGRMASRDNR